MLSKGSGGITFAGNLSTRVSIGSGGGAGGSANGGNGGSPGPAAKTVVVP